MDLESECARRLRQKGLLVGGGRCGLGEGMHDLTLGFTCCRAQYRGLAAGRRATCHTCSRYCHHRSKSTVRADTNDRHGSAVVPGGRNRIFSYWANSGGGMRCRRDPAGFFITSFKR